MSSSYALYMGTGGWPQVSADGTTVVWRKSATTIGAVHFGPNGSITTTTETIPSAVFITFAQYGNALSYDGRFVAFEDLMPDGTKEGFVFDRYLGTRTSATVNAQGQFPNNYPNGTVSDFYAISGDGNYVFWDSDGDFWMPTPIGRDIIRRDWRSATPTNQLMSAVSLGNGQFSCGQSYFPSINATGQVLAFSTYQQCQGTTDPDASYDVILRDASQSTFSLWSNHTDGSNDPGAFTRPLLSASGRFMLFSGPDDYTQSTGSASSGAYFRDRGQSGAQRVSWGYDTNHQYQGLDGSGEAISPDGGYLVYSFADTTTSPAVTRMMGGTSYTGFNEPVQATFTCQNANVPLGTQNIYVLGSIPELGGWIRPMAIKLSPVSGTNFKTWQTSAAVPLPANTSIQWKCIRRNDTNVFWLNDNERKAGDTIDPLLWSNTGSGPSGNFVGTTSASGSQTFTGSF
jgi:hypothetical protein